MPILVKHQGDTPRIHPTAYIAPTATISGDVEVGEKTCVLFGAVLTAEGGPIRIGSECVIMENAVIRSSRQHAVQIGNNVLVGPRAYLTGCLVEDCSFLATGVAVFNGAHLGARCEVRINGVVHLNTRIPADATIPIGWVALGDPAKIFPPQAHDEIWDIQKELNFPREVWRLDRPAPGQTIMPEITRRYTRFLHRHKSDETLDSQFQSEP